MATYCVYGSVCAIDIVVHVITGHTDLHITVTLTANNVPNLLL